MGQTQIQIIISIHSLIVGLVIHYVDLMLLQKDHGLILKIHPKTYLNLKEMLMKINISKRMDGGDIENKVYLFNLYAFSYFLKLIFI